MADFQPDDRVHYRLGEGSYWEAVVIRPVQSDQLRYLIRVENGDCGAVKVKKGYTFAACPDRLKKV